MAIRFGLATNLPHPGVSVEADGRKTVERTSGMAEALLRQAVPLAMLLSAALDAGRSSISRFVV